MRPSTEREFDWRAPWMCLKIRACRFCFDCLCHWHYCSKVHCLYDYWSFSTKTTESMASSPFFSALLSLGWVLSILLVVESLKMFFNFLHNRQVCGFSIIKSQNLFNILLCIQIVQFQQVKLNLLVFALWDQKNQLHENLQQHQLRIKLE